MLRLLYLLIRQRLLRTHLAGDAVALRVRWLVVAVCAGALALALGVAIHALRGEHGASVARSADPAPGKAVLVVHVAQVESMPLVVYLQALGAAHADAVEDALMQRVPAQLTSINGVFEPAFQIAPVAARIEVGNVDPIAHNTHVFEGQRTLFNVALPLQQTPVTKVLTRPGLFEVRCDLHPWMHAVLFVPPNRHHLVIREPGEFTLHEIPPGRYRVHAWAAGRGRTTQVIDLQPGATRMLDLVSL